AVVRGEGEMLTAEIPGDAHGRVAAGDEAVELGFMGEPDVPVGTAADSPLVLPRAELRHLTIGRDAGDVREREVGEEIRILGREGLGDVSRPFGPDDDFV